MIDDDFSRAIESETGLLTVLLDQPEQTDETDVTDFSDQDAACPQLSNQDFMAALFDRYDLAGSVPNVIQKATVKPGDTDWRGHRWSKHESLDLPDRNLYFTLAAYSPDTVTKRKTDCTAICGLMLDDLGTKAVPLNRLTLKPTYIIETSTGNFQAGYLFDAPQTDFKLCEAVNKAMIEAGLCDPGATGPTSRWGRLPEASNTKYAPVFKCRLHSFEPELRYTPDQIIEGLDLQPAAVKKAKVKDPDHQKQTVAQARDCGSEDVFLPRASENEVITALKQRGLYKQPLGGGKHDITCPWVSEHTDQIDHGTAYFEPDELFPVGGFSCRHGHGESKRMKALLEFLGLTFKEAKNKATIRVVAGEAHQIVDKVEQELAGTGRYYQSGSLFSVIGEDPASGAFSIKALKLNALIRAMSRVAIWEKFDGREKAWVTIDPMQKHAAMLFDAESYQHLPCLIGLARQPYLRPDGKLVATAGFDAGSGYFGVFNTRDFSIPTSPTKAQAQAALADLAYLINEVRFKTQNDHAAALAGMLTAAARSSLRLAPMFHCKAPTIASGKSFLMRIIAGFSTPAKVPANGMPGENEELRKLLLTELMTSPPAIIFDNLTSDLIPYPKLCSALTEEFLTDRVLGFSKAVTVSTRTMFLSSGNNVGPVRDMTRRCITIELDPGVENPLEIEHSHNPERELEQHRGQYVSAALTVIRAWHCAGRPMTECKNFASYDQWSDWIRQPLLWLGQPDPVAAVFEAMAHDPDRETLGRVMAAWLASFGRQPTLVREAIAAAQNAPELKEALIEVADQRGEINNKRLGKWLSRNEGRIVGAMRFTKDDSANSAQRWILRHETAKSSVTSVSSVSSGLNNKTVNDEKNTIEEGAL